jgi:hypothetical protein
MKVVINLFDTKNYSSGGDYAYVEYAHNRTTGAVYDRVVRLFVGIAYEWDTDFAASEAAALAYYANHSIADFKAMEPVDDRW